MNLLAPIPTPSVSGGVTFRAPDCTADLLCSQVWRLTGVEWLAQSSYVIVIKPLRIIGIILVALAIRWLLHRAIRRLATAGARAGVPTILRPLRERVPGPSTEALPVPERRRQRAEAISSVLRSFVSVVVFAMATLLCIGELGFNLGPLLASAGIVGVALGFGAQTLVKDLIAGLFLLLEDQYGMGDTVDLGEATGIVEAVGLRITTVRDGRGVLWYIRNGEIIRVGNKSQGWAMVVIDMPVGFVNSEEASAVLREAAMSVAEDPELAVGFLEPPDVLGVEQLTVDGAMIRTIAKTTADAQFPITQALRRRLTEALETSGISARIAASRTYPRPAAPPTAGAAGGNGAPGGAT